MFYLYKKHKYESIKNLQYCSNIGNRWTFSLVYSTKKELKETEEVLDQCSDRYYQEINK